MPRRHASPGTRKAIGSISDRKLPLRRAALKTILAKQNRKLAKKTKKNDAIMTGILVTRFKMGQINVEDLEEMAADTTRAERCSAARKVLDAIEDSV